MEETIKIVAKHFGYDNVEIEVIQKKLSYVLKTKDENLLIRKNFKSNNDILRQLEIQNAIIKEEYKNLSYFVLDEDSLPYCNVEDETYTILKNSSKEEINLNNKTQVLEAVKELAKFHQKAKNLSIDETYKTIKTFNIDDIDKDIKEIDKIKKLVNKSKKKTEFDIYVLKNYNKYIERANKVKEVLLTTKYEELENESINNNHICLNLIKEEQFTLKNDNIIINSLVESSIGYQLNDLVKFIYRYLRKNIINENSDLLSVNEIIEAYNSINNIDDINMKIIEAKIMYPVEFFKVVKKHYQKHRGWIMGVISNKIKELENIDSIYLEHCNKEI